MLIMPSFKKGLIVEQFQGNYLNNKQAENCASDIGVTISANWIPFLLKMPAKNI